MLQRVAYSAKTRETCKHIFEKQRLVAQRLIRLLYSILSHLSSNQEIIHSTVDFTHHSLCDFIERATSTFSPKCKNLRPSETQATSILVDKVLNATYPQLSSSLEDVKLTVDRTFGALAEATSGVMFCLIENILADAESGALTLLCAQVGEMEAIIANLVMEVEAARKQLKIAEKEKSKAVKISQDMQAAFMLFTGDGRPPFPGSSYSKVKTKLSLQYEEKLIFIFYKTACGSGGKWEAKGSSSTPTVGVLSLKDLVPDWSVKDLLYSAREHQVSSILSQNKSFFLRAMQCQATLSFAQAERLKKSH